MDVYMLVPVLIYILMEGLVLYKFKQYLDQKISFKIFDRTTWIIIVCIGNIIGFCFYMYMEES